jgi:hypothetical protein
MSFFCYFTSPNAPNHTQTPSATMVISRCISLLLLLVPIGEGDGIMISGFQAREFGMNQQLNDEQLAEINARREGKDYVSMEEAILLNGTSKKQRLTREQFDKNLVDSPFLKSFRYGQKHDGYWTGAHMKLQLEDVVDCCNMLHSLSSVISFAAWARNY